MRNRLANALRGLEVSRPEFKASDFARVLAALSKPEPLRGDFATARAYRRAMRRQRTV
jgi:hypothetical protein